MTFVLIVAKIIRSIRESFLAVVTQVSAQFFTIADTAIMSVKRKFLSTIGRVKFVMAMRAVRKHTEIEKAISVPGE